MPREAAGQVHFVFLLTSICQIAIAIYGRPRRLMAGWKFHLAQLTKSFPTDFNYLGPRWNGLLLPDRVNATKQRKPWARTDIIVRWPHDCLSPIMRSLQQSLDKQFQVVHWKFRKIMKIQCNLTFDRDFRSPKLVQFHRLVSCAWCLHCRAKCKKGRFNWQTWSKWAACEAVRKIIQLNASLHTNWGKNELLEKGGRRAGSLWQKWSYQMFCNIIKEWIDEIMLRQRSWRKCPHRKYAVVDVDFYVDNGGDCSDDPDMTIMLISILGLRWLMLKSRRSKKEILSALS